MEKRNDKDQVNKGPQPDPETLHTTDPQEHMKGPFSSTMHKTGEGFESNEDKKEATKKRDERL